MLARSERLCRGGVGTLDGTSDDPYVSDLEKALRTGRGRTPPRNAIVFFSSNLGSPMSRPSSASSATGPVRLSAQATAALRPGIAPTVTAGFWYERRAVNARVGIPQGPKLLESAGDPHNFRLAAGQVEGEFIGDYPFQDTDVYKWLEAACWQLAQDGAADGDSELGEQ